MLHRRCAQHVSVQCHMLHEAGTLHVPRISRAQTQQLSLVTHLQWLLGHMHFKHACAIEHAMVSIMCMATSRPGVRMAGTALLQHGQPQTRSACCRSTTDAKKHKIGLVQGVAQKPPKEHQEGGDLLTSINTATRSAEDLESPSSVAKRPMADLEGASTYLACTVTVTRLRIPQMKGPAPLPHECTDPMRQSFKTALQSGCESCSWLLARCSTCCLYHTELPCPAMQRRSCQLAGSRRIR
jgi:hypothetical protein